jgi:hypothetical protein
MDMRTRFHLQTFVSPRTALSAPREPTVLKLIFTSALLPDIDGAIRWGQAGMALS